MPKHGNTKPKKVSYGKGPEKLWHSIEKYLPVYTYWTGRPRADNRTVLNTIWFVLWSGSQWKEVERHWFGVSSSVIHERFQTWGRQAVFENFLKAMLRFYHRQARIHWKWQSLDSKAVSSTLVGADIDKNPTDRAKLSSKIHILVDQQGLPLSIVVTGANENDKWFVEALVLSILLERPASRKHFCADKAYDSWDVHLFVKQHQYIPHIKHRRRVNEPLPECPIPGEYRYPARRWVVERTLSWLVKRRSIWTRWCRK